MDTELRTHLEIGGMHTLAGQVERPTDLADWLVPAAVQIDGGVLHWHAGPGRAGPDDGLLGAFLALRDEAQVEAFARRWGVLFPGRTSDDPAGPSIPSAGTERVEDWFALAHDARLLLETAAYLHEPKLLDPPDWSTMRSATVTDPARSIETRLAEMAGRHSGDPVTPGSARADLGLLSLDWGSSPVAALRSEVSDLGPPRELVASVLNRWIRAARVDFALRWAEGSAVAIDMQPESVFGAVAVQLLHVVSRVDGFAICSACAQPFAPKRRPRQGERRYCGAEPCQRAANRERQRTYRQKRAVTPSR